MIAIFKKKVSERKGHISTAEAKLLPSQLLGRQDALQSKPWRKN